MIHICLGKVLTPTLFQMPEEKKEKLYRRSRGNYSDEEMLGRSRQCTETELWADVCGSFTPCNHLSHSNH